MSSGTSNESSNLASGIVVGIVAFSVFGLVTYGLLLVSGLKSPVDRIADGDFSKEVKAVRAEVTSAARKSQLEAFDEKKVVAAMASFKAAPQADSSVPVPGLVVEEAPQPEAPAVEPKPAEKVEATPAEEAAPKKRKKGKKAQEE